MRSIKTYVISQAHLPFFRYIINRETNKIFLILTTTYVEYFIGLMLKLTAKSHVTVKLLRTNGQQVTPPQLERFRKQSVIQSNINTILKKQKNHVALQWNGLEYLECEVRSLCETSILLENGYFRPNSLTIDHTFIRNSPLGLRDGYRTNNLLDEFDHSTLKIGYANFNKLSLLDLLYRLLRSRTGIRPRKQYFRSASLSNILQNFKFQNKQSNIEPNYANTLVYYGQVADDSALILDPNYKKIKDRLLQLYKWAQSEELQMIYRPHPLELNDPLIQWFSEHDIPIDRSRNIQALFAAGTHATFSSTVGFELLQRNKSVIVLGDPFYSCAPGVLSISDLESEIESRTPDQTQIRLYIEKCKDNHIIF